MSDAPQLMDMLREETREQHKQIDHSEFFLALIQQRLPLESYVSFLKAMATINFVLEGELANAKLFEVDEVWCAADMSKLDQTRRDLLFFEPRKLANVENCNDHIMETVKKIRSWGHSEPVRLLGCLYVIEGSTLGSKVLKPKLAQLFNLENESGLAYFSTYGTQVNERWNIFKQKMNALDLSEDNFQKVINSAQVLFTGIAKIMSALYPINNSLLYVASSINSAAGNYEVATDPREILAAFDAGENSWRTFPYYAWRYGEKGVAFTRSDSAWLVTLSERNSESIYKYVEWIGEIMSSRGMPRLLLELHLLDLHDTLCKAVPERGEQYAKLQQAAWQLKAERQKWISDGRFEELAAAFDIRVAGLGIALKNMGAIVVAAPIDQKMGLDKAVSSLRSWLTDPNRFPNSWISAVQDTLRETQLSLGIVDHGDNLIDPPSSGH